MEKKDKGFAALKKQNPDRLREIAAAGGRAAHEQGTAHEWTADEGKKAGRKGGHVSRGGRGRVISGGGDGAE